MSIKKHERTLEECVVDLGEAYVRWKDGEADKDAFKAEFFAFADQEIQTRGLAIKMVEIPAADEAQARARVSRHYPSWLIDEVRKALSKTAIYEAVLRENPAHKPFSFTHEGVTYAREIRRGTVMLDEEWLGEEDPGLYGQVTFELPWGDVIPLPIDQIPKDVVNQLSKYIYQTPPRASLAKPKAAKEES